MGLCILILLIFEIWEYLSPLPAIEWTVTNLVRIHIKDPDHFSFAVFGNNKGSRVVFNNLLKLIDHDTEIDFAIDLGDTVLKGQKTDYQFFLDITE